MKKRFLSIFLVFLLVLTACGNKDKEGDEITHYSDQGSEKDSAKENKENEPLTLEDAEGRQVTIPKEVKKICCIGVGALRYTTYLGAQDLVCGVEDYETKQSIQRLYNFVNFDKFKDLPIVGGNGKPNPEALIKAAPDLIIMSRFASMKADELQEKTSIPVLVIPGSDRALDEGSYKSFEILGKALNMTDKADKLNSYLKGLEEDLKKRSSGDANAADKEKRVYVGGVSFKGAHGFEGTEAGYAPLYLIGAKNLANEFEKDKAFDMDLEKLLEMDPDIIFVDLGGIKIMKEQYKENPSFYNELKAFKEGKIYSLIPFRSYASNLDTAILDAYYAGKIIYPEAFKDVDLEKKNSEILQHLLGQDPSQALKDAGLVTGEIKFE